MKFFKNLSNQTKSIQSNQLNLSIRLNTYPLYLGKVSKRFTVDNIEKADYTDMCLIFSLIMKVLMLIIL